MQSLDGKHTLFGEVAEDENGVVGMLNAAIVDDDLRPLQNIRIRRTTVLDDPFPDPDGLAAVIPEHSPEPVYEFGDRLEEDWKPEADQRCCPVLASLSHMCEHDIALSHHDGVEALFPVWSACIRKQLYFRVCVLRTLFA
jgi:hypothetical protein